LTREEEAMSLINSAESYHVEGRYEDAEPLLRHALEIKEEDLGPDHPDVARVLGKLAENYHAQERYEDAEPLLERSRKIQEEALGPNHPDVAMTLGKIADNYKARDRHEEAEPFLKLSLEILKRSTEIKEKTQGADHQDGAASLTNLAENDQAQGRKAEAEPFLKRSKENPNKVFGSDHPDILLVERVVRGEQAAIVMFYEQYKKVIKATIRKFSFIREYEVEDYIQEFMVRLMDDNWRRLTMWKGNCRLSTYLVSILKNFLMDQRRKHRPMEDESALDAVGEDPTDDIEDTIFTKQVLPRSRKCLNSLSERDREIINRVLVKDDSADEVAEALGLAKATYYKALHDAKKRLAKCMKVEFPFLFEDDL
jgi:RNA polymerase sigma factor (sigma-70 family)